MAKVIPTKIEKEMQDSYLDYAMSVIVSRALPDVRDGLKPVQRRILWTMWEDGLKPEVKFKKSASVVGLCLARYHPHGDAAVYDALARMVQDFSLRYPLIEGQGNWGCFTKDTKVRLTDGRNLSFEELVKEAKEGKRNFTFTFNPFTKKIEIAEIKNPRKTRKNERIVEITLDNGEKIKCTLDHKFMLRDGTYKEAKDLKVGDSLMPLYTDFYDGKENKHLKGYEIIYQPFLNKWEFVHYLADQWNIEHKIYSKEAGRVRHHKDFNKLNNNPTNILRIPWQDHWKYHKEISTWRHKNDPEYVKKLAEGRKKYIQTHKEVFSERARNLNKKLWQNPQFRAKISKKIKELWQNKEYRERMKKISSENLKNLWRREGFRVLLSQLKSEEMKERWKDSLYRESQRKRMKELSKKLWKNPEHRAYISELMKKIASTPEWRERQSKIAKKLWQNPEFRKKFPPDHFKKMAEKLWSKPGAKEFFRKKILEQWKDPLFREKVIQALKKRAKENLKKDPDYMKKLTEKAKIALHQKWQDPTYKTRVIKSKILSFVKSLFKKYKKITPKIYEKERINNGVPRIENALKLFDEDFSSILREAKKYNHKVIKIRFLKKREDVYDLTTEPWHNFALGAGIFVHNSIDGDPQAAQRYTECKLSKMAVPMLEDIEKETIDWEDNYDRSRKEPKVLPAGLPNLLINGSMGIAVGMATNIPPHNLGEIIDGLSYLIDHPDASLDELLKFIKGPDFPTGGILFANSGLKEAYQTGRGAVILRGKCEIEETSKKTAIIVKEIPYQVNKAELIKKIAELVEAKKIEGIKTIRDESDKEGIRVVIELKSNVSPKKVLNCLYQYTDLQKAYHFNIVALVDGIQPQLLSLKDLLTYYLEHRKEVVTRRSKYLLKKTQERIHILEGLAKALKSIDKVISLIKKSKTYQEAKEKLQKFLKITEIQAKAILEIKLQNLVKLEKEKIEKELTEKRKFEKYLKELLRSERKILEVIKKELLSLKEKFADKRRTQIETKKIKEFKEEDLIQKEPTIILFSNQNYIKRVSPLILKVQKRGGKGIVGFQKKDDFLKLVLFAQTTDDLFFFTDKGKVYQLRAYQIPETSRTSVGKSIYNFLEISKDEKIFSIKNFSYDSKKSYLIFATKNGFAKKTKVEEFSNIRKNGILAIKLQKDDALVGVDFCDKEDEIFLSSSFGNSILFKEKDLREMGRVASGVLAMKLKDKDEIVSLLSLKKEEKKDGKLLVVTEKGYGKLVKIKDFRLQKRAGKGIRLAKITEKTGKISFVLKVIDLEKDLLLISQKGLMLKTTLKEIPTLSRNASGVKLMKVEKDDKIIGGSLL